MEWDTLGLEPMVGCKDLRLNYDVDSGGWGIQQCAK